jgi:hypothetical protein
VEVDRLLCGLGGAASLSGSASIRGGAGRRRAGGWQRDGVMPSALVAKEVAHNGLTDLRVVFDAGTQGADV